MVNDTNRKTIVNLSMLVLCLLLISLASIDPYLSFLSIVAVVPMVLIGMEANPVFSLSAALLISALAFLLGGLQFALATCLMYVLPGLVSGIFIANESFVSVDRVRFKIRLQKGDDIYKFASLKMFLLSVAFFAVGLLAYTAILKYYLNLDLVKNLQIDINTVLDLYKKNLTAEEYKTIKDAGFIEFMSNSSSLYLLITYIKSIMMALIAYYLCIPLSRLAYKEKIHNIPVDNIFLPGRPVLVLFVIVVSLYAIELSFPNLDLMSVINNFILIMNLLFFLEGASLIVFIVKNWKHIKKEVNMLIIFVIIVFMGILPGIGILGMLDNMLNYRQRWYSNSKDRGDSYGK